MDHLGQTRQHGRACGTWAELLFVTVLTHAAPQIWGKDQLASYIEWLSNADEEDSD